MAHIIMLAPHKFSEMSRDGSIIMLAPHEFSEMLCDGRIIMLSPWVHIIMQTHVIHGTISPESPCGKDISWKTLGNKLRNHFNALPHRWFGIFQMSTCIMICHEPK